MKKYLICLVLTIALGQIAYGQSLNKLMDNLSKVENIETVKIGPFMMTLGKAFGGVGDMPVARGIHSMEVYDLSSCNSAVKQNLTDQMEKLKDGDGYETLLMAKDKDDNVRIMMKKKNNTISDMVILCMSANDPTIVKFSGKIKEEDLTQLVQKYDKQHLLKLRKHNYK